VVDGVGVAALIVENWGGPPHGTMHEFVLEKDGRRRCSLKASFTKWTPLKEAVATTPTRQMQWLVRNGFVDGVYVGAGVLEPLDCAQLQLVGVAALSLKEGGEDHGTAPIELEGLSMRNGQPSSPPARPRPSVAAPPPASPNEPNEQRWRGAFALARRNLEQASQRIGATQKALDTRDGLVGGGTRHLGTNEQLKAQLAQQTEARAVAEAQLEALEREASNAGVPREWRR
jgi:hypothetical protein